MQSNNGSVQKQTKDFTLFWSKGNDAMTQKRALNIHRGSKKL